MKRSTPSPVADELLAALVEQGGVAVGMRAYRDLVEVKAAVADAAMKLLVEEGTVEKDKQGNAYRYRVTPRGYAELDMDAPHEQEGLL